MQEREFQVDHIDRTIDSVERFRTTLAQLPTGGGKTVEFSYIIKKYLRNHIDIEVGPVLILVHREELLNQAARTVEEVLGFQPCLITSQTSRFWIARVYIGMVESTLSRLHMINHPSLVIIDECHLQNFNKVHRQFPEARIIGFSATPISVSKREPMNKYYDNIISGPSIKYLINQGYLSQNITRAPKTAVDPSSFQFDRLKGDYNERQMSETYSMSSNVENCVMAYHKYSYGKKTLIFNVSIAHSMKVNECFNACGFAAKHLDSNCKDRKEILQWFKETPNAILNSVMIPTMGYDEPTIQTIMLNYSTLSMPKFLQTCGRGSRIVDDYYINKFQQDYPYELKPKNYFNIIDLGQNWKQFGDWNDERDWDYIFWHPDLPGNGIAPVKTCPGCDALVHASVRLCPYCGHYFAKKEVKQQDMEEMILITKGIDVNALAERSEKKYKYYPFYEMAADIVTNLFTIHGNKPSQKMIDRHFRTYYAMCVEWFKKTLAGKDSEMEDISDSQWHISKARNNFNALILKRNKLSLVVKDEVLDLLRDGEDYEAVRDLHWKNYKSSSNWA